MSSTIEGCPYSLINSLENVEDKVPTESRPSQFHGRYCITLTNITIGSFQSTNLYENKKGKIMRSIRLLNKSNIHPKHTEIHRYHTVLFKSLLGNN